MMRRRVVRINSKTFASDVPEQDSFNNPLNVSLVFSCSANFVLILYWVNEFVEVSFDLPWVGSWNLFLLDCPSGEKFFASCLYCGCFGNIPQVWLESGYMGQEVSSGICLEGFLPCSCSWEEDYLLGLLVFGVPLWENPRPEPLIARRHLYSFSHWRELARCSWSLK